MVVKGELERFHVNKFTCKELRKGRGSLVGLAEVNEEDRGGVEHGQGQASAQGTWKPPARPTRTGRARSAAGEDARTASTPWRVAACSRGHHSRAGAAPRKLCCFSAPRPKAATEPGSAAQSSRTRVLRSLRMRQVSASPPVPRHVWRARGKGLLREGGGGGA